MRTRIVWTEAESEQVARQFIKLRAADTKIGEGLCLMEAQKVLPENRRRKNLSGFSQAPKVLEVINKLQSPAVLPHIDIDSVLEAIPTDTLMDLLKVRQPSLFEALPTAPMLTVTPSDGEMEASLAERRPDLFVASAPIPKLVESIFSKTLRAITTELRTATAEAKTGLRETRIVDIDKLNQQIAVDREMLAKQLAEDRKGIANQIATSQKVLTDKIDSDRSKVEERLYTIQNQVNGILNGTLKPKQPVVVPTPEDKEGYMPIIMLAGGDRQDFQRLQGQMVNANIRLQKIDVSNPRHISIAANDRVIVWTSKLSSELQNSIVSKVNPTKLTIHHGTYDELGPVVIEEARRIRKSK